MGSVIEDVGYDDVVCKGEGKLICNDKILVLFEFVVELVCDDDIEESYCIDGGGY